MHLLHLLDDSTPPDALDQLALLTARTPDVRHSFATQGSHLTARLAADAGLPASEFHRLPSAGWADPTGWRALRRLAFLQPTHLVAWGIRALIAASTGYMKYLGAPLPQIAVFAEPPARRHARLLRIAQRHADWQLIALTPAAARCLHSAGIDPTRLHALPTAVSLAPPPNLTPPAELRLSLGLDSSDGPVLLLAGDGPDARHDFGIWAAAIIEQLFPRTRVLLRDDPRRRTDPGLDRFTNTLPDDDMLAVAPADTPWSTLARAADLLLATPSDPERCGGAGALFAAMAANLPILATPQPCITDVIAHGHTGLLSKQPTPRALASRLEEFMSDSTLGYPLTTNARAFLHEHHAPSKMVEGLLAILQGTPDPRPV